ncbi:sulfite exporter TauE/SafE family protein [Streptosporangium sp. NPDC051022]|uniref:sulfite exporter TauE/SafE family protein n=1 Tax=Streptosporangium sp. NPDC051022 TaxID=3155752 RepID=UPI003440D1F8
MFTGLTVVESLAVLLAGLAAGVVNTVAGSGSLITFPTLVALGFPPVVANVSNTVGLAPGSISGTLAYLPELRAQRARLVPLGVASALGAVCGGILLLRLPPAAFDAVVPVLVLLAALLMAVQPWLAGRAAAVRSGALARGLPVAVFAVSVYGGYFGAAQGVLLMALLACVLDEDLQRLNGLKNLLQALVNVVAAVFYALTTEVAWGAALLVAVGSVIGGQLGATIARWLPPTVLRYVIVVVGTVVGVALALT